MADQKISAMSAASALTGAEVLPVVQSAANVKATTQQVVDAAMTTGLTRQALGSINTNTTIDWSLGSYATATITGALTFTFSNPAASGKACVAYLQLTNGGSATITWPVSVTWSGGTAPTLRASGVDLLRFYTQDGGTTWFGTSENDEPDTTGLTEPLTVTRATRQSSALTAASAGEVKFQFKDIVRAGILAVRSDVSEEQTVLPSVSNPYVTGAWVENGTTIRAKGQNSATVGTASASTILSGSVCAVNLATAASAGSGSIWYNNGVFQLRDGSAAGDGYLAWGLVSYPDSDYGSGSTGCVLRLGLYASGASTTDGTRCSGRSAFLEYNTVQGDTNWTLCVHNGTDMATSSTGVAFAAAKAWFFIIHSPRGGTSTYAYIYNVTDGAGGGTSLARNTGSTALSMYTGVITRTTVARNMRFQSMFARVGGQI